mmetsp:Transcript_58495/g.128251  ORF Transcript_58495/g.128251 Transcript_58495/m.128251 type:complete len:396 (-) Transcript_58495:184-1371(-)|eukprot:CAMPEP_0204319766 /NCGR_PEP_ID=MMETSP0469-20131031/7274_1 /ASSEMBLY_ACC=CAM_ASM_000384 /TAXON_ID=2969 /ORGANISM="Oxyrrhis marina" /LENGTH=395 /DNA_ID=CAMNT_0051300971 /DNA_START=46 /DNA_END=1233 /DNA_ORIENTATION=+
MRTAGFLLPLATAWMADDALRAQTAARTPIKPLQVTINLDQKPEDRWSVLAGNPIFKGYKKDYTDYLATYLPKAFLPLVADIAANLRRAFWPDYAAEMEGLAKALGVSVGDVVLANLIYQLEHLGVACDKRNTTGPCPPPQGPGACTGVVVNGRDDRDGEVWQGRNLDWNLNAALLRYVMQVDYQRANKTVFSGVQIAGEIGVLHGLRKGAFSVQLDARATGGNVLLNFLELIGKGAKTPTHVMRHALENAGSFADGVAALNGQEMANPAYFIVAGANKGEGAIMTMERKAAKDIWHLYEEPAKDTKHINPQPEWYRVQTNYDHWEGVPAEDDRRTASVVNVQEFCGNGIVDQNCVRKVMTTWPTQNHHTDVTSIMCPRTGYFDSTVWLPSAILV